MCTPTEPNHNPPCRTTAVERRFARDLHCVFAALSANGLPAPDRRHYFRRSHLATCTQLVRRDRQRPDPETPSAAL